jgi:hypothetical protein
MSAWQQIDGLFDRLLYILFFSPPALCCQPRSIYGLCQQCCRVVLASNAEGDTLLGQSNFCLTWPVPIRELLKKSVQVHAVVLCPSLPQQLITDYLKSNFRLWLVKISPKQNSLSCFVGDVQRWCGALYIYFPVGPWEDRLLFTYSTKRNHYVVGG